MLRREFITLLGGASVAWPTSAVAQQQALPVVSFVRDGTAEASAKYLTAFRNGLAETGYIEGRNVLVEYHWVKGEYDRLPAVMDDLVRRRVAVIVTPGGVPTQAAKAATAAVPIVFGIGDDPVELGLVASLARPGGNATGINFFSQEVVAKRLRLLHELVPRAVRIAVLVNPSNAAINKPAIRNVQDAASVMGLQIEIMNAGTINEIDGAFAAFSRERVDALFVAPDAFFISRAVQLVALASRDRIPAAYAVRELVAAGGLMSYGADFTDSLRDAGVYTGKILNGVKPADLPVLQSTKFEFAINLKTARSLGIEVPARLLLMADEVIE